MSVSNPRAFRFGVLAGGASDADAWTSLARRVEGAGYSTFLCTDHLDLSGAHMASLAPVPALAAAASVTSRIGLGSSVFNQDLRHPAVIAQEAATLDILSRGRFELGLGAGWAEYEYNWAGIKFDPIATRIERLREYIQVVKALLEQREVSFIGRHFRITAMPGVPSVRRPRPPIMLGGTYRRMLTLAAEEAEIVSIICRPGTREAMQERVDWIRRAAGDRIHELELATVVLTVSVGDGARGTLVRIANERRAARGLGGPLDGDELLASPTALVGSVSSVAEELAQWRERWGISYVVIGYPETEELTPVVEELSGQGQ